MISTKKNPIELAPLSDAPWSSEAMRAQHMSRVRIAVRPWESASVKGKTAFARRLAELTIRRVLPIVLDSRGFTEEARMCRREGTIDAARVNAYAAYARAAYDFAFPAPAAHAAHAADAAEGAAADAYDAYAAYAAYASAAHASAAADAAPRDAALAALFVPQHVRFRAAASYAARAAYDGAKAVEYPDRVLVEACDCLVEAAKELTP